MSSKTVAKHSVLISLCIVLSYIEVLIPFNVGVLGVKLGLSNIVVLYALYTINLKSAFLINILRTIINGFLFSSVTTMLYSFSGGILSLCAMSVVKKSKKLSLVSVSVTGGIFHNIGQIIMAYFYLKTDKVFFYLPYLTFFGTLTGILTGYLSFVVIERVKK